jgi:hypothetical protein
VRRYVVVEIDAVVPVVGKEAVADRAAGAAGVVDAVAG